MKLNAMIKEGKFEAKDAKIGYVGAFPMQRLSPATPHSSSA